MELATRSHTLYRLVSVSCLMLCLLQVNCEPAAEDADATQTSNTNNDVTEEQGPAPEELLCTSGVCTCSGEAPCTMTCNGFCEASCGASSECLLNCPQGSCRLTCTSGRSCALNCPAGGCSITCPLGAQCSSVCPGGACPCNGGGCS